ncbi:serine/threonine protein kinase [Paenibacillus sp. DS2015]|uniref:serine/threonine protein kinase n=1 Tax=Paenibacillus sp. DS2015 TaxID=3373917 RepID=UPI003D20056E
MRKGSMNGVLARNTMLGKEPIYQIRRICSCSELSVVYIARHVETGTKSVIKEFFPRALARRSSNGKTLQCLQASVSPQFVKLMEAFQREAKVLCDVQHPGIVGYEDYFEANGTAYLVMEYCSGITLDQVVRKNDKVMNADFLRTSMLPLIGAMEHIHQQGFVHRDIRPANIIIGEDGRSKLIDFGSVIRYTESDAERSIFTTAGYSPLELYSEKSIQTPAADIYSLAATLYFCCIGAAPTAVPTRLFEDKLDSVRLLNRDVSPLLSRVIHWGLSLSSHKRCGSLRWFRLALRAEYILQKKSVVRLIGRKPTAVPHSLPAERELQHSK